MPFLKKTSDRTPSSQVETSSEESEAPVRSMQLEAFAEELHERLVKDKLLKDRKHGSKYLYDSFTGRDAVTVLREILRDENCGIPATREYALQVGRDIAAEFQYFAFARKSKKSAPAVMILEDNNSDLYQFQNNLPTQVHKMKKEYPSMWDKVRLMQSKVRVGDHAGIVRSYANSFVAQEAVDCLMELKLVKSRREAVHLVRKMNEKVGCCRHVSLPETTKFADDDQIFKFIPVGEQTPRPAKSLSPKRSKSSRQLIKGSKSSRQLIKGLDKFNVSFMNDTSGKSDPISETASVAVKTVRTAKTTASEASRKSKDPAYFKTRAADIRSRLNVHRNTRSTPTATTA